MYTSCLGRFTIGHAHVTSCHAHISWAQVCTKQSKTNRAKHNRARQVRLSACSFRGWLGLVWLMCASGLRELGLNQHGVLKETARRSVKSKRVVLTAHWLHKCSCIIMLCVDVWGKGRFQCADGDFEEAQQGGAGLRNFCRYHISAMFRHGHGLLILI